MFTDPRKIMFRVIGALVCASILIFIYSKYNRYITGPEIVSINIENHQTTETPSLFLQAEVTDTQSIFLNGRSLILQNKKNIEEIIVFSPGNNIIEIVLEDSFGKSREYVYHIRYNNTDQKPALTHEQAKEEVETDKTLPTTPDNNQ